MEKSLFQIEQEYIELLSNIDESGEISEDIFEALQIAEKDLQTKGAKYGYIIKKYESDILTIKLELERLSKLKKTAEKKVELLKDSLRNAMQLFGVDKIDNPTMKISLRKSEQVDVEDLEELSSEYVVSKVVRTPDKKLIKEAIKKGIEVKGARIVSNKNLQIK